MPMTEQEQRCVDLVCAHLAATEGGAWRVVEHLDEQHPDEPSPEVLLTNGPRTAAVEVKRLTGPADVQQYIESTLSLERYLAPSCGGCYHLEPPFPTSMPLDKKFTRYLKREIERVARDLAVDQTGAIPVPRSGLISMNSDTGGPYIRCMHTWAGDDSLRPVLGRIEGVYLLVDHGPKHTFVTDAGREAFCAAVTAACARRRAGITGPFEWVEEWPITKADDQQQPGAVWVMATTEVLPDAAEECVRAMVAKAQAKFTWRRWADLHVVTLDTSIVVPTDQARRAVADLGPTETRGIDLIVLVDRDAVVSASFDRSAEREAG
jgi:hypothetical protein